MGKCAACGSWSTRCRICGKHKQRHDIAQGDLCFDCYHACFRPCEICWEHFPLTAMVNFQHHSRNFEIPGDGYTRFACVECFGRTLNAVQS